MTSESSENEFDRSDRRLRQLPFWHPRRLHGRRRRMRRAEEHARPYIVDGISLPNFALASLLLVLTLVDGMITVALVDRGCEEANPLMRYFLDQSIGAFFVAKYTMTAVFLPVALVMYQYRLFGTRFRVGYSIPAVAALYLILIAYQIGLWNQKFDRDAGAGSRLGIGFPTHAPARPGKGPGMARPGGVP